MVEEPANRDAEPAGQWLQTYHQSLLKQQELATTAQAHRDQMLTWTIGLLGLSLFQAYLMLASPTCQPAGAHKSMAALLPWALAFMCALVGRLTGAEYSRIAAIVNFGQEHRFRLLLTERASLERVREVLKNLADDPSLAHYGRVLKRVDRITHWLYLLTHALFLIGFILVLWRIGKC